MLLVASFDYCAKMAAKLINSKIILQGVSSVAINEQVAQGVD